MYILILLFFIKIYQSYFFYLIMIKFVKRFLDAAKATEENFYLDCEKTHRIPTHEKYKIMFEARDKYINKAAHANGIISRGIAAVTK